MKNVLFLVLLLLSSCASYYDDYGDLLYKEYNLKFRVDYNTFTVLDRMPNGAGRKVYYPQKFKINLPKKIKNYIINGDNYVFEFENKQIIGINAVYQNYNKRPEKWHLEDADINEIHDFLSGYYHDRLVTYYKKNKSIPAKMYTNGEVKILLYNIRSENVERYLSLIKSFKYLD